MRWSCAAALAAALLAPCAKASFQCNLAGSPSLVTLGGLAEPVGDIVLSCVGAPGQTARITLGVWLDRPIANPPVPSGSSVAGAALWLESDAPPRLLTSAARLQGGVLLFDTVNAAANPSGGLVLRVTGIRAEAAEAIRARILMIADATFLLANQTVMVGVAVPGLMTTPMAALACCAGPPLPDSMNWQSVLARKPWTGAVRVSEGYASSFQRPDPANPAIGATRVLVRIQGLPPGSRVFVPDGVAGRNAAAPTRSGLFQDPPDPGAYLPGPPRSLLLSRVAQADRDGTGGTAVLGAAPSSLDGVGEATVEDTEAWVVYEVRDANPSAVETAEIPVWIFTPVSRINERVIVRVSAVLAPLSEVSGSAPGAPVPRYQPAESNSDCTLLEDCTADYFPRLSVIPSLTSEFALAAGARPKSAALFVRNLGGHFIEWTASARYLRGEGWLKLHGTGGLLEGSYYYDLDPGKLTPGEYRAEIIFEQRNSPTGSNAKIVIPVRLTVTEGPPPQQPPENPPVPPRPEIWGALTVPLDLGGPFAPGGLIRLQGRFFAPETKVTVNGVEAIVVAAQPDVLLVQVPETVAPGWVEIIASNSTEAGAPYRLPLLSAAPSLVRLANASGEDNSEAAPAAAGTEAILEVTGVALANDPVWVNVHDLWREARREPGSGPGLHRLRVVIPEELQAMKTAIRLCVTAPGIDGICSHPRTIWIAAAP
ncbi:MAG: hypothetical protein N2036_12705 [Bryobacteraceae bacterium]|nr:hypothetical protein [Bryobacteraceae bacterium]MCX7604929.1 hypothetical protein [Bryobacteraceae bacterium]